MAETMTRGQGKKPNQRMQHFLVLQYLLEHSDENHFISTEEIVSYLKDSCGISAERRSIYKDVNEINIAYVILNEGVTHQEAIELLEDDTDLETIRYKKNNGYYVARRPLHISDARLIVECVHTARFVTKRESENIADDIGKLLSENQRAQIKHEAFAVARVKNDNARLFENVDIIHEAMANKINGKLHEPEKIRFRYLKCTIQNRKQKAECRNGNDYVVSPHAIMINEGNYYLLGIEDKKKKLRTYRVDRMTKVRLTGERRDTNTETDNLKEYLETYPQRVFSMYGGRRENVRIRFVNTLLDTVYDRFGDYASYFIEDDRHFTVSVSVEISPMFFGWLCGFGNKAVLLSPDAVIEEFLKHVDKMYEKYKQS